MTNSHTHSTTYGDKLYTWDVHRLWELAKDLPVKEISIESLSLLDRNCWFNDDEPPTVRRVVEHARKALDVDLDRPIILNVDGIVMDGAHRVVKALLEGRETVSAVQFTEMPEPDSISDR